ncbi:serpentine type 7TM GPCR chemoreceptor srt domain-containing protein [Ditylenchus destructor]|uniref:Serpentine type 7TM GPCR chemoreceptor srt domain-containing protein n=1 Tax=Ditylenchus destructor TaxID=166010 RepID=A0AAD4MHT1_9BILA|nr:serpentine type 7TM GPCR chemoreceptor srt domain-containing protein [Ditylenchus destructor]
MEFFVFRHAEYKIVYSCPYDVNIVPVEKRVHKIYGLSMLGLSLFFVLVYIPTLIVIAWKFLKKTAYQLMLVIGLADITMLSVVAIPYGIMSMRGDVFCSHPTISYILSCTSGCLWVLSTEMSAVLALYRCLELWRPSVAEFFYKVSPTYN